MPILLPELSVSCQGLRFLSILGAAVVRFRPMKERYVTAAEVRELRQGLGLTQQEAAAVCGVDERTYQRWELGEARVRRVYVEKLRASTTKSIARVLDQRSPIEDALRLLMAHVGGVAAAVFLADTESSRVSLLFGLAVDDAALDRTNGAWAQDASGLQAGRIFWRGDWCAAPIETPRGLLLVYVGSADTMVLSDVEEAISALRGSFAAAVALAPEKASAVAEAVIDSYLEREPLRAIERRQLANLLKQHEWNLARVARVLGVSRVTIYKRLTKLGLERVHVRKTPLRGSST